MTPEALLDKLESIVQERDAKVAALLKERRKIIEQALKAHDQQRANELAAKLRS